MHILGGMRHARRDTGGRRCHVQPLDLTGSAARSLLSKACPAGALTCGAVQRFQLNSAGAMPFPPLFATAVIPPCVRPRVRARAGDLIYAVWARMSQLSSLRRSGGARCFSTTAVFLVHCQVSHRICQLSVRGEGGRGRAAACGRNRCAGTSLGEAVAAPAPGTQLPRCGAAHPSSAQR